MVCDHNDGLDADYIGILSVYPDFEVYRCECGALINIGDASAQHEVVEDSRVVKIVSDPMTGDQIRAAVEAAVTHDRERRRSRPAKEAHGT